MTTPGQSGTNFPEVIDIPDEYLSILYIPFLLMLIYYFSKIKQKSTGEHILYVAIVIMLLTNVGNVLNVVYFRGR